MKHSLPAQIATTTLAAVLVASCGGGSDVAGIDGTGIAATGTITGFGSIYVNGIRFDVNSASVSVDDAVATDQDLRLGMVVTVTGTLNADGVTATADSVVYDGEVQGPLDNLLYDANGTTATFTVLGTTVVAESGITIFESEDNSDPGFAFDTLAVGDIVEVSGYWDADGNLSATRVEKKDPFSEDVEAGEVEIKGYVANWDATARTFDINGITVQVTDNTRLDDLNEISDGIYVEVKGDYDADTNTVTANKVEAEDEGIPGVSDGDDLSLEGIVSGYVSNADFTVNGQQVDASGARFEPASLETSLADGIRVEVEGYLENGVLKATKVEGRDASSEIEAFVESVDATAGTVTLSVIPGSGSVTVIVDEQTLLENEVDDAYYYYDDILAALQPGDWVEVKVMVDDNGDLRATHLKRESGDEAEKVKVEAPIDSLDSTLFTITVMGVTFETSASTDFDGMDQTTFFTTAQAGDMVEIEDDVGGDGNDGIADKVELKIGSEHDD